MVDAEGWGCCGDAERFVPVGGVGKCSWASRVGWDVGAGMVLMEEELVLVVLFVAARVEVGRGGEPLGECVAVLARRVSSVIVRFAETGRGHSGAVELEAVDVVVLWVGEVAAGRSGATVV